MRDDRWVIQDLTGKGKRLRLVPVPGRVKDRLDFWTGGGEHYRGGDISGGGTKRHLRWSQPNLHRTGIVRA
jgi:hypothetical protein